MDQEKQETVSPLTARSAAWHEFITFLTEDLFDKELRQFIREHMPKFKSLYPVGPNQTTFNFRIEDWEWRLFEISDAIAAYLEDQGHFLTRAKYSSLAGLGRSLHDFFWAEIKLRRPELWKPGYIDIRTDELGTRVLVGFEKPIRAFSIGPITLPNPFGPQE